MSVKLLLSHFTKEIQVHPRSASLLLVSTTCLLVSSAACQTTEVKLNQFQVIGTHNSYHAGIAPSESKVWQAKYANAYKGLDYQHPPLPQQLDAGVRQIELDVYADTKGGRYAHPSGPSMAAAAGLPADPPFDPDNIMSKPGFKVMHVQDVDYRSTCQPFTACLQQVRDWSHAHPGHVPIFILVETKQDSPKGLKLTEPEPFTSATFDSLDAEIRSVFPASEIVTPDDVRGHFETLNQAVWMGIPPCADASSSPTPSRVSPMPPSSNAMTDPPPTSPRSSERATLSAPAPTPTPNRLVLTTRPCGMP
jgi:hypothetical protein